MYFNNRIFTLFRLFPASERYAEKIKNLLNNCAKTVDKISIVCYTEKNNRFLILN